MSLDILKIFDKKYFQIEGKTCFWTNIEDKRTFGCPLELFEGRGFNNSKGPL